MTVDCPDESQREKVLFDWFNQHMHCGKYTHQHAAFYRVEVSMLTDLLAVHQQQLKESRALQGQEPRGRACEFQQASWPHTPPPQMQWKTVNCLWQSCDSALHVGKLNWSRLHCDTVRDAPFTNCAACGL